MPHHRLRFDEGGGASRAAPANDLIRQKSSGQPSERAMSIHSRLKMADAIRADTLDVALEPDFDFGSDAYRSLFVRAQATPFQSPRWLELLYSKVAPAFRAESVPVTVRDRSTGALVFVLPLVRLRHGALSTLSFADFGLCDYCEAIYEFELYATLGHRIVRRARARRAAQGRSHLADKASDERSRSEGAVSRRISRADARLRSRGYGRSPMDRMAAANLEWELAARARLETAPLLQGRNSALRAAGE